MAEKRLRALIESRYDSAGTDQARRSFVELEQTGTGTARQLSSVLDQFELDGLIRGLKTGQASLGDFSDSLLDAAKNANLSQAELVELAGASGLFSRGAMAAAEASSNMEAKAKSLSLAVSAGEISARDAGREFRRFADEQAKMAKQAGASTSALSQLDKMLRVIGVAITLQAVTRGVVNFGKAAVQAASDAEEMQSKFDAVFQDTAPQTAKALEDFGAAVNRSRFDLMEMAATVQDTFVPLGFARDQAADLSIELVKLATDVASFNNKLDADVMRDFQSALVGNHETVRKYGIIITEARLAQELALAGAEKLTGEALEQAKVQARLNLIIAGTADAHGDAARTADSYANVSRGLDAAMQDLTVTIGQGLVPALKQGKQAGMEFVQAVLGPANAWALLMQAVDEGLISQTRANMLFAQMVYTGKSAADILGELEQKFQLVDDAAEAASGSYEELIRATVALALAKGKLTQREHDAILAHHGLTEASDRQTKALSENRDVVRDLHERLGLLTREQYEFVRAAEDSDRVMLGLAEAHRIAAAAAGDHAMSQEELKQAFDDLKLAVSDPLGRASDRFGARQTDLMRQVEELKREIAGLESLSFLTPDQATQLEALRSELGQATQAVSDNADEWDRATKEIIFNLAAQMAATMENKQVAYDLLASVVEAWGLAGDATVDAIRILGEAFSLAEQDADRAKQMILSLGDAANAISGDYYLRFNIIINEMRTLDPNNELDEKRLRKKFQQQAGLETVIANQVRASLPAVSSGTGGGGQGGAGARPAGATREEPEPDPIQQAFQLMGALSGVGDIAADRLRSKVIDPLKKQIEAIDELVSPAHVDMLARERLVELEAKRADASRQVAEAEERILEFQRRQQDLRFLEQQVKLLELIQEHELDRLEVLGGLKLGIEADEGEVLEAMTRALDALIRETERKLELASPSKRYTRYGRQLDQGLVLGIEQDRAQVEMARDRMLASALPPVSAGVGLAPRASEGRSVTIENLEIAIDVQNINDMIDWNDATRRVIEEMKRRLP